MSQAIVMGKYSIELPQRMVLIYETAARQIDEQISSNSDRLSAEKKTSLLGRILCRVGLGWMCASGKRCLSLQNEIKELREIQKTLPILTLRVFTKVGVSPRVYKIFEQAFKREKDTKQFVEDLHYI